VSATTRILSLLATLPLTVGLAASPAQAAPLPYQICNSGNSVSIIRGHEHVWPYENDYVLPGSSNCGYWVDNVSNLWIDPDSSDVNNAYYDDVERWRIRPGNSSTYGPWHCGEVEFNPPDAWLTQGGIDVQTSGSIGTTCTGNEP
jgi:hypothetical protein